MSPTAEERLAVLEEKVDAMDAKLDQLVAAVLPRGEYDVAHRALEKLVEMQSLRIAALEKAQARMLWALAGTFGTALLALGIFLLEGHLSI